VTLFEFLNFYDNSANPAQNHPRWLPTSTERPCDTISVGGQQLMDVIAALQDEATKLKKQLDTVLHAMHLLGKGKSKKVPIKRRRMSAAGKARIAAAQKKRWARVRAAKKKAA
jgi:hypothetical protein